MQTISEIVGHCRFPTEQMSAAGDVDADTIWCFNTGEGAVALAPQSKLTQSGIVAFFVSSFDEKRRIYGARIGNRHAGHEALHCCG